MSAIRAFGKRAIIRTAVVLGGLAALTLGGAQLSSSSAHAATYLHYQRGLYLDNGWLCYGWANGAYHCTQRWHWSNGRLVSNNPAWVPTGGGSVSTYRAVPVSYRTGTAISATPWGISQWAYTGHPAYAMSDYRGDPNAGYFGTCTWYAQYRRMDERLLSLGNAWQWAFNAPRHGPPTGSMPRVGATVVFQPGVQGASSLGHAGHVEAVYANGWFLESAMSTYWNGGGWGRVSFVYAHAGPGVSFIY
jgi:surface antigen